MPRVGLTMDTVLESAAALADEQGLEAVTLAELGKRLGVKTPSLYNHIDGLTGLRKHLAIHGIHALRECLMERTVGKAGEEAVAAVALAYVEFVRMHPGLYEATLSAPDPLDEEVRRASEAVVVFMLKLIEGLRLSEPDALHTVRALRSMVHGFASLESRNGFNLELDRNESLTRMITVYLRGLNFQ